MNEKVAKKVGEAYAFAHTLHTTFNNYQQVMEALFGSHADSLVQITESQKIDLEMIAKESGVDEIVLPKAERTSEKIMNMGDMYVGDEWDNPVEVLEWMSFFVGGAIVHWQLIEGSAEALGHEKFIEVAKKGTVYYSDLMKQLQEHSIIVGKQRVTE